MNSDRVEPGGATIPPFSQLPTAAGLPAGSSWGVFGAEDHVGTLNFVTAEAVTRAAALVRDGAVFSLNWELEQPDPPLLGRGRIEHRILPLEPGGFDDYYDNFFPQASSQWDALSHTEHLEHGYYNGRSTADVSDPVAPANGIEHWARRGIAGRFVLIDVDRYLAATSRAIDHAASVPVGTDVLDAALAAEGVELAPGDILLINFGWLDWYERIGAELRRKLSDQDVEMSAPGLLAAEETARWLWDYRVAAVAADVPALEAMPFDESTEAGFLHYRLIPLLGYAVGEMFKLGPLARACASDGRYVGLFTAAPLNKLGGAGSPANALALR